MAQQGRRQHKQHQKAGQKIPRLQADDAHHAHRRPGNVQGGHRARHVHQAQRPKADGRHRPQAAALVGREGRCKHQHCRAGQIQQGNGHIQRAEHPQLADEEVVLIQGAQHHGQIPQRVFQHKQQLRQLVGPLAHPAEIAVVVAEGHTVPLKKAGDGQRQRQPRQRHLPFLPPGFPSGAGQDQRQRQPQQVDVGLGHVHQRKGQQKQPHVPVGDLVLAVKAGHQIVAAQQHGVVAAAGRHKQAQRQQHHGQKHRLVAPAVFQCQPAPEGITRQVGQPRRI